MLSVFKQATPAKLRMLIVDDSNIIRGRIERGQHNAAIEVVASAADGVEAMELARKHLPDIATMDITMPKMDGIECIRRIVEIRADILILVVSALNDQGMILKALQAGAHGFLSKPFNEASLNAALAELIK